MKKLIFSEILKIMGKWSVYEKIIDSPAKRPIEVVVERGLLD